MPNLTATDGRTRRTRLSGVARKYNGDLWDGTTFTTAVAE